MFLVHKICSISKKVRTAKCVYILMYMCCKRNVCKRKTAENCLISLSVINESVAFFVVGWLIGHRGNDQYVKSLQLYVSS